MWDKELEDDQRGEVGKSRHHEDGQRMQREVVLHQPGKGRPAQGVVKSQRGGDDRPVGPVRRKDAEGCSTREKARHIMEAADPRVIHHGVEIVEVKAILKRIGIREIYRQDRELAIPRASNRQNGLQKRARSGSWDGAR